MDNALLKWMKENGFSNAQLGAELGIGREVVWAYSSSKRQPSDQFKWQFTMRFGVKAASEAFELDLQAQGEPV